MGLTTEQIRSIRDIVGDTAGAAATVRVFGSRLRDDAAGGDLDLLVELPSAVEHPAALSARLAARISRTMHGRRIDVLVLAPNLRRLPIHDIALQEGQSLWPWPHHRRAPAVSRPGRRQGGPAPSPDHRASLYRTVHARAGRGVGQGARLAERVDAFVSRSGRLQDTLGDKLLPALLIALGEKVQAVIDNLTRAERLGFVPSAEQWMEMRKLRNQMVHDYVEDPLILADALETARGFVTVLTDVADRLRGEIDRRGWA